MLSQYKSYKTYKPYFTRSDLLKIDPPQSFNFPNLSNKEKKEILNLKEQVKILTDMVISCQKDVEALRLEVNKDNKKEEEEEEEDEKEEEKVNKDDENKSGSKYLLYFSSAALLSSIYYTFKKR